MKPRRLSRPGTAAATRLRRLAASLCFVRCLIASAEAEGRNTPTVGFEGRPFGQVASIRSEAIFGLIMDLWCYEDPTLTPVSHRMEGKALALVHKLGSTTVTSRFEPVVDGVDIRVKVTGPSPADVKAQWVPSPSPSVDPNQIRYLNSCCMLERAPSFAGTGDYVDDFVCVSGRIADEASPRL